MAISPNLPSRVEANYPTIDIPKTEPVDCSPHMSHPCVNEQLMPLKTKFLRLRQPATVGDELDGWRVCWLGGWDKNQLLYWVMVVSVEANLDPNRTALAFLCNDACESE